MPEKESFSVNVPFCIDTVYMFSVINIYIQSTHLVIIMLFIKTYFMVSSSPFIASIAVSDYGCAVLSENVKLEKFDTVFSFCRSNNAQ